VQSEKGIKTTSEIISADQFGSKVYQMSPLSPQRQVYILIHIYISRLKTTSVANKVFIAVVGSFSVLPLNELAIVELKYPALLQKVVYLLPLSTTIIPFSFTVHRSPIYLSHLPIFPSGAFNTTHTHTQTYKQILQIT